MSSLLSAFDRLDVVPPADEAAAAPTSPSGRMATTDFVPLRLIGRGAFGEVRLVRRVGGTDVYALKSMVKESMEVKNQVAHVRAERDAMALADNPWIVKLVYSFQVGVAPLPFARAPVPARLTEPPLPVAAGLHHAVHGHGVPPGGRPDGASDETRHSH